MTHSRAFFASVLASAAPVLSACGSSEGTTVAGASGTVSGSTASGADLVMARADEVSSMLPSVPTDNADGLPATSVQEPAEVSIGTLVGTLGRPVLQLVCAPGGTAASTLAPLVGGLDDDGSAADRRILLATGLVRTLSELRRVLREAVRIGCPAVVIRASGLEPESVAEAGDAAGIAVFLTPEPMSWRHLDRLVAADCAVGSARERGLSAGPTTDLFSLGNEIAYAVGGAVTIEDEADRAVAYSNLPHQEIDGVGGQPWSRSDRCVRGPCSGAGGRWDRSGCDNGQAAGGGRCVLRGLASVVGLRDLRRHGLCVGPGQGDPRRGRASQAGGRHRPEDHRRRSADGRGRGRGGTPPGGAGDLRASALNAFDLGVSPVQALREHDRRRGTEPAKTLLAWLDAFGEARTAATALFVRENTLRYRVRTISERFCIDLVDPYVRLVTWLELRPRT